MYEQVVSAASPPNQLICENIRGLQEQQQNPVQFSTLDNDLSSLETKIFGHDSNGQSVDQRLEHLEQKVFGDKTPPDSIGVTGRLKRIHDFIDAQPTSAPSQPDKSSAPSKPPPAIAPAAAKPRITNRSATPHVVSNYDPLILIQIAIQEKNYKLARRLCDAYIKRKPLDSTGYYLVGLVDINEHTSPPEYDQFAFDQFLKGLCLNPSDPKCNSMCGLMVQALQAQTQVDPLAIAAPVYIYGSPNVLLNAGVNCYRRDRENDARDLLDFVIKKYPGAAASAHYNLGAIAESRGRMETAIKEYESARISIKERIKALANGSLKTAMADVLSDEQAKNSIDSVNEKIATSNYRWTGELPNSSCYLTQRCLISTQSAFVRNDVFFIFPNTRPIQVAEPGPAPGPELGPNFLRNFPTLESHPLGARR